MDVEWFKAAKRRAGVNDQQIADAMGVERSVANKVVNGKVPLNARRAGSVAKLLKSTIEEIMFRAGITSDAPPPIEKVSDQPVPRDPSAGETVEIVQLNLSLPMGSGATIDDYIEEEARVFDLAYIRGFTHTPPHRLRLARGVGDSMFPTLQTSDLVWIDSTQRQLNQTDRIWAVSINGGAAIKRLRPLREGRVLVKSDNPGVDDYEVDADEIVIGGRVIRFARDV